GGRGDPGVCNLRDEVVEPTGHRPEHGVSARRGVERRFRVGDEELASLTVRIGAPGHRDRACGVHAVCGNVLEWAEAESDVARAITVHRPALDEFRCITG